MTENQEFVTSIVSALSENGAIAELKFTRGNGTISHIRFPTEQTSSVMLSIEQSLGELFEKRLKITKGVDPKLIFPVAAKTVTTVQGAVSRQGTPVITFVLSSGLRLDFAVDRELVRELSEWLATLEQAQSQPQKPPN